MNKLKLKRKLVAPICIMLMCSISTAHAANTFTFKFSYYLSGKTEFALKNRYTSCKSKAVTYKYGTTELASFTGHYRIDLDGNGIFAPDYTGSYKSANGREYRTPYNTIKENTYTVNICSYDDLIGNGVEIKGNGNIEQN